MSEIDIEKTRAIAYGDFNEAFIRLRLIFEQRKIAAKLIMDLYGTVQISTTLEFIEGCNQVIKEEFIL